MIEFTREINLAINLICLLNDKPITTLQISEKLQVNKSSILNLTYKLDRAGLIVTKKGKGGGIVAGINDPSLYDLFECLYGGNNSTCTGRAAELHWLMTEAMKNIKIKANYTTLKPLPRTKEDQIALTTLPPDEPETAVDEVIKEVEEGFSW